MIYYELTGEEYICDGVWHTVTICEGKKAHCNKIKKLEERGSQYRDLYVRRIDTENLCPCQQLHSEKISYEDWVKLLDSGELCC